uniref:helix-turn-helix domain-containing protein n=1 Tax=Streptomyces umbrinus TaxID=67370 RepID=UPI0027D77D73|nr:helix-turn-helix domain-containing protein [Streptomyces umbrinus]
MRYAHGGGLTPKQQEKRERVRLEAAERFARGEKSEAVARELRVTSRSVRRWRREWEQGGADALRSKGPVSVERLSRSQWERLERELKRGPLVSGGDHAIAASCRTSRPRLDGVPETERPWSTPGAAARQRSGSVASDTPATTALSQSARLSQRTGLVPNFPGG